MTQDNDPSHASDGSRPPDYVIVLAASDWVEEHFPAAGANLQGVLHGGQDRSPDPESDLEAEP